MLAKIRKLTPADNWMNGSLFPVPEGICISPPSCPLLSPRLPVHYSGHAMRVLSSNILPHSCFPVPSRHRPLSYSAPKVFFWLWRSCKGSPVCTCKQCPLPQLQQPAWPCLEGNTIGYCRKPIITRTRLLPPGEMYSPSSPGNLSIKRKIYTPNVNILFAEIAIRL